MLPLSEGRAGVIWTVAPQESERLLALSDAAFLSELFGTKVRYSGVSIGYQLPSILAGGIAPLVAVYLYTRFDSGYAVSVYVLVCSLVTIAAVATYTETRNRDLAADTGIAGTKPWSTAR